MPTPPAKKFEKLLSFLVDRYPFRELRALLLEHQVEAATSKAKLFEKFTELTGAAADHANEVLSMLCADLVVAGTKDVFVFDLDQEETERIAASLARIEPSASAYSPAYPLPLSESELKSRTTDHELVRKIVYPSGDIALVLCAKRSQEERVVYEYSQVTEAVKAAFEDFDEFIAVRRVDYQIFDTVTLRKSLRRLEVLIDQPSRIRMPTTSGSRCTVVLGRLSTLVDGIAPLYEANSPLNLSACVSALYHASTEGRVSQMSFRAPTGSVNRGSVAAQDLRKEKFHAGGFAAVGDVTPYDVTISWDNLVGSHGEVSLQVGMPMRALSATGGVVDHARIIDARSDAAIIAVVNKLVSYSTG